MEEISAMKDVMNGTSILLRGTSCLMQRTSYLLEYLSKWYEYMERRITTYMALPPAPKEMKDATTQTDSVSFWRWASTRF